MEKGGKMKNCRVASLESISIYLSVLDGPNAHDDYSIIT